MSDEIKLDLGSGPAPREDYTSVDLFVPAGVKDDVRYLREFDAESVSEIYSSHTLEHIALADVPRALFNWHRVLAPGGKLEVVVPNLPAILREWLDAYDQGVPVFDLHTRRPSLAMIFGNQEHEGEFHKSGFDAKVLRRLLVQAGFVDVQIEEIRDHYQPSLRATATKMGGTDT